MLPLPASSSFAVVFINVFARVAPHDAVIIRRQIRVAVVHSAASARLLAA